MLTKLQIIGNLGNNPRIGQFPDGTDVANFSVASNRRWNDQQTGEVMEETTWYQVQVNGRQATACYDFLTKGRKVYIEGRLKPDPATGGPKLFQRADGTVSAAYDIIASNVIFLDNRPETAVMEDDLPFDPDPPVRMVAERAPRQQSRPRPSARPTRAAAR